MTVLSAIFLLFIIMDPIGNVPLFLSILKNIAPERRRKIIIRELLIALLVLLVFMFSGKYILAFLQISESSLGIAGGIMLLTISFKMILQATNPGTTLATTFGAATGNTIKIKITFTDPAYSS